MAELAAAGRYWWMAGDRSFYATAEYQPNTAGDVYLLDASDEWKAQWGGDWHNAADVLSPMFDRLEQEA